jgi:hypothetical protein
MNESQTALVSHDASDLPAVIERARALFSRGDVLAARELASGAYDAAKLAGRLAVSEKLLTKARALQGDALLIEVRAKVRIADEYDAAQEAGVASKGRPKTIPGGKTFTLDEAGLSAKQIHEARALRDAERREPGIAERAIAARLAAGFEPTRAAVRGIGTRSASKDERGDDFYQTPREAIHALLCLERFGELIWEPSCGHGAISKPMEAAGYEVFISDLVDRACANEFGELQATGDFLKTDWAFHGLGPEALDPATDMPLNRAEHEIDIVTNPPFGLVNDYIHHALTVFRPRKMAMLLNLNALCGAGDEKRNFWMETWPPARVLVFSRRLPMMHREGYDGPVSGSQMNCAWFVWVRQPVAGGDADHASASAGEAGTLPQAAGTTPGLYGNQTILQRVDWKALADQPVLGPEGAEI